MSRLDLEARMAIKTLSGKTTKTKIARLLGVSEGAVRYHVSRMKAEAVDGRSRQLFKAQKLAEAIEHWRGQQQGPLNLSLLYQWLRTEKDYDGSLRSVQRFWKRTYPAPAIRARRRVETPAGAQAQVDWALFPSVVIGGDGPRGSQSVVPARNLSARPCAIIITTNKSIRDWTELLAGDEVLATAILDRLLHRSNVLNIKGRSYRLRDLEAALKRVDA